MNNILLLGARGSGKTSFGRLLADQLLKTFVDVDDQICEQFDHKTISEIWHEHGESAFREVEVEVTRELCQKSDMVISLGGGTLMQFEARQAVEQARDTVRIYLKCDPVVLHERIRVDKQTAATRPALTPLGGSLMEIKAILAQREPVYEAVADKVFDTSHVTPEDGVLHLINRCL